MINSFRNFIGPFFEEIHDFHSAFTHTWGTFYTCDLLKLLELFGLLELWGCLGDFGVLSPMKGDDGTLQRGRQNPFLDQTRHMCSTFQQLFISNSIFPKSYQRFNDFILKNQESSKSCYLLFQFEAQNMLTSRCGFRKF